MGTINSSDQTKERAKKLAEEIGRSAYVLYVYMYELGKLMVQSLCKGCDVSWNVLHQTSQVTAI